MANSADPDQLASSEANWSGSTLFAKAGYIRVQQDKGKETKSLIHSITGLGHKVMVGFSCFTLHYENMPIQIYWKFYNQKLKIFR